MNRFIIYIYDYFIINITFGKIYSNNSLLGILNYKSIQSNHLTDVSHKLLYVK